MVVALMNCHGFGTQSLSGCYHAVCECCGIVISEKEIRQSPERDGVYTLQCDECGTKIDYQAKFVRGEPQNIALIGHKGWLATIWSTWSTQLW